MRKYKEDIEDSDSLREWVINSDDVSAPEGFTHNVMSRINLETIPPGLISGSFPGIRFRIVSLIVFSILILLTFLVPSIDRDALPSFLKWAPDLSGISLNLKFPDFQLFHVDLTLMYISIGVFMLVLLNIIIEKYIWSAKR